jgi:holo-[acyl-carrier protein] synthase
MNTDAGCTGFILGIGTDLIKIDRIDRLRQRYSQRFLSRIFTAGEIEFCRARLNVSASLAARFAAKEAVRKALSTDGVKGCSWRDIEIIARPDGKPAVKLHNKTAALAAQKEVGSVLISLSHEKELALAFAMAIRRDCKYAGGYRGRNEEPRPNSYKHLWHPRNRFNGKCRSTSGKFAPKYFR